MTSAWQDWAGVAAGQRLPLLHSVCMVVSCSLCCWVYLQLWQDGKAGFVLVHTALFNEDKLVSRPRKSEELFGEATDGDG